MTSPAKKSKEVIYLASYLGFSPEYLPYLKKVRAKLRGLGYHVLCPWERNNVTDKEIKWVLAATSYAERVKRFAPVAQRIGSGNAEDIRKSDIVFAVVDGTEPDSGTISEIGYGAGLGKKIYGLRTDLRNAGEFTGIPLNLQVYYFLVNFGGKLFRSIDEIDF